jgi:uncharacterized protein YciU (UPF0263 family)
MSEKILAAPVDDLARRLGAMIDDELFAVMELLEKASENRQQQDLDDVLARIALTESEIEKRYPGMLLLPYRNWKQQKAAS